MSDVFDSREKSEEAKYKMDAEMRFKAQSRRNKLLGLWAAERMGLGKDEAASYAKDVVAVDFDEPGDGDVIRKVMKDLGDRGAGISEDDLREQMDRLYAKALEQLSKEYPDALGPDHSRVGGE
ncbi:MAG: DUF1476 domain-containing protein [Hyphomicrobiales bacterium]|nr:DUF1476 domain-containing protein [Hyphomicrobiales bacterium]MCP5372445.1 DUF1476 domain-containing protein [Hyphomicrobiales bacterium]